MSTGTQLLSKAEKKASSSVGWFGSQSSKWEEAGDLFQQSPGQLDLIKALAENARRAANQFKIEKQWKQSGEAFEREAACRVQGNEPNDAMNAYKNAANSYKKTHPEAAVSALHNCIQLLIKAGNFRQAADREKEIAQIYAQDSLDIAKARDSYVRAGEWYKQEEANATANQCYQQAAELSGDLGDYQRSMELYLIVGDWSLSSQLTKYSVKEYWLRAALCSIAMGDLVTTSRIMDDFARKDVTFPSTREAKFAHELYQSCEEADVERYLKAVHEYDQVTRLDNWKTGVLLRIKKALEEDEAGLT